MYFNLDGSEAMYSPSVAEVAAKAIAFLLLRAKFAPLVNGPEGLLNKYPQSFNEPLQEWLEKNKVEAVSGTVISEC